MAEGYVRGVAFSPDGKILAAGFGKVPPGDPRGHSLPWGDSSRGFGGVVLFDTTTRQRLHAKPLPVTEGEVFGVAYSPDGQTLAVGYGKVSGGGVVLFDTTTRQRLQPGLLPVPEGEVWSVAFSPDGKILAAGDGSGGVVLFDLTTRQRFYPGELSLNPGDVSSVAFSPGGKTLAVGEIVGVAWYDVDLESWRRLAGRVANRNLTRDEWRLYFPDTPYRPTFNELPVPLEAIPSSTKRTSRIQDRCPVTMKAQCLLPSPFILSSRAPRSAGSGSDSEPSRHGRSATTRLR